MLEFQMEKNIYHFSSCSIMGHKLTPTLQRHLTYEENIAYFSYLNYFIFSYIILTLILHMFSEHTGCKMLYDN